MTPIYAQCIFDLGISQKQLDECDFLYFLEIYAYRIQNPPNKNDEDGDKTLKGLPEDDEEEVQ